MKYFFDMDGVLAKWMFGTPYEKIFEKDYFKTLPPQEEVLKAAKILSKEYDVYVISAYLADSKYALNEKKEWLKKWLPEVDEKHQIFLPCGNSKADLMNPATDILIDDNGINCREWKEAGGTYIKVSVDPEDMEIEKKRHTNTIHPYLPAQEIVRYVLEKGEA